MTATIVLPVAPADPTATADHPSDRALRAARAAAHLGISEPMLRKLSQQGRLPFVKIGRATCWQISDLDHFLRANRHTRSA